MLYACAMVCYIYSFVQFVKMCGSMFVDSVAKRVYNTEEYKYGTQRHARFIKIMKHMAKMIVSILLATGFMMLTF